jgi:putative DNA primase/helicase
VSAAKAEAAGYYRLGWNPIPVKERSKQTSLLQLAPYLTRRVTEEEMERWSWPGVGIVTGRLSGVLVLDVDGEEGKAELSRRGHPATPMARTPGGGLHIYLRHPDAELRTGIRVAPGLDVKAAGGYVVAPPSLGPNGGRYEWIISPAEAELADPPAWLLELLQPGERKGPAPPVGEKIPSGERNKALASIAGTMRRRGMGEAEILAALQVANERRCSPPLPAREVEKIAASVGRYEPEPPDNVVHITVGGRGAPNSPAHFNLTDLGNAERLLARHGENVRYCYPWGCWLVWTGARWERDEGGKVHRLAKETVRGIYAEAAAAESEERRKMLAKHATASEAESRIRAMLELAKSDVPVSPDELDADPWLLNVQNGTVDLRTGELRPHRREDLLTKMAGAGYDPKADAATWEAFLERVLPGEELRGFVRRAAGYSATGVTSEQIMLINHGGGSNGKSTFQEALAAALGDYAMRTPTEMLLAKRSGGVPNDVARLKGARFVSASETEEGRRLAEGLIKDLTGQDTISARFMRAEWFDFKPTHKLWLSTNHKPEIRGTDNAIWRRIRLVPWAVTIPPTERDHKLPEKLQKEMRGVLGWVVHGCLEWRQEGLRAPDEVRKATGAYRAEMDVLAAFISEECAVKDEASVAAGALYGRYREWCLDAGEKPESQRKFGERLKERGYQRQRITSGSNKGKYEYLGIGLRHPGTTITVGGEPLGSKSDSGEPLRGAPEEQSFTTESSCKIAVNTPSEQVHGEGSEPNLHINASENIPRGVMCEKGSLPSLRSPQDEKRQNSNADDAQPRSYWRNHPLDCDCEECEFGEMGAV